MIVPRLLARQRCGDPQFFQLIAGGTQLSRPLIQVRPQRCQLVTVFAVDRGRIVGTVVGGVTLRLDFYPPEDLEKIILRSARLLGVPCDKDGARELSTRSRGTPRVANRLVRRVRDFAEVQGSGKIDREMPGIILALQAHRAADSGARRNGLAER